MDTASGNRCRVTSGKHTWRAGCGESRTSGSAGGMGKRTGRKPGTAPHADPSKECGPTLRPEAVLEGSTHHGCHDRAACGVW
jgi:hypothetical protein